jgi:DNA-binding CsgD family transcriptional regulator
MNVDRVKRLTDKQRECLRLVYRHMETKEIARELGLSPDGVTQRIKSAMKTLGVDRRRDAALILAEAEGLGPYPRQVYQSRDVASAPEPVMLVPSIEGERQHGAPPVGALREEQSAFEVAPSLHSRGLQLPLPIRGGRPNDLNSWQRLGWIFAVMLMIAFMFGVFLAGLEALSRLGRLIAS